MSQTGKIRKPDEDYNESSNDPSLSATRNDTLSPFESMQRKINDSFFKRSTQIPESNESSMGENKPLNKFKQTEKSSEESSSRENTAYSLSSLYFEKGSVGKMDTSGSSEPSLNSKKETASSKTLELCGPHSISKTDDEKLSREGLLHSPNPESRLKNQLSLELNVDEIYMNECKGTQKDLNNSKRNEGSHKEVLKNQGVIELNKEEKHKDASKGSNDRSVVRTSETLENGKKITITKIRLLKNEELEDFDVSKLTDYERRELLEHIEKEKK